MTGSPLALLPFLPRMFVRGGPPLHLTFFVTSRCQLACGHCFYHRSLNPLGRRELGVEEVERIAAGMGPLLWLAITGGEPFVRSDLPELVGALDRACRPRVLTIVSNGWATESIASQLPGILAASGTIQLNLSLDGPREVHDGLRGREGAFERLLESYERAARVAERDRRLGLGINTAFHSGSPEAMEPLSELVLQQLRPRHWDIALVRDPPRDPEVQRVELEAYLAWKARLEERLRSRELPYHRMPAQRLAMARHLQQNDFERDYLRQPGYRIPCLAGSLSAVLYDDGALAACEQRPEFLGNLRDAGYDFRAVWRGAAARRLRERIAEERCHCDHGCNIAINTLFQPRCVARLPLRVLRLWRRGA